MEAAENGASVWQVEDEPVAAKKPGPDEEKKGLAEENEEPAKEKEEPAEEEWKEAEEGRSEADAKAHRALCLEW